MLIKAVNSIGAGVRYELGHGDSLTVGRDISIISTTSYAVQVGFHREDLVDNLTITVAGLIQGQYDGIYVGQRGAEDDVRILIEETGIVSGGRFGINIGTNVLCGGGIENQGLVKGERALVLTSAGGGIFTIENSGTLLGNAAAIDRMEAQDGSDGTVRLTNSGLIAGASYSYAAGGAVGAGEVDVVRNTGVMRGDIFLGDGNDIYDGRGGRVFGEISGADGGDLFRPGAGAELINGGAGNDVIDFRSGDSVRVDLDNPARNRGSAAGDVYTGIDLILGSQRGDDVLRTGNSAADLLGFGGRDTLIGGGFGEDLAGGKGRDVLTGGGGDDRFIFNAPDEGGDRITDFDRINSEQIFVQDTGFRAGLQAGDLNADQFHTSANSNRAADADDRFIFRTSDTTLWFDRDGRGGADPVLIADLQAGAVLTAADIIVF